jgi:hypothetical protein
LASPAFRSILAEREILDKAPARSWCDATIPISADFDPAERLGLVVRPGGFGQRWRDYLHSDTELDQF